MIHIVINCAGNKYLKFVNKFIVEIVVHTLILHCLQNNIDVDVNHRSAWVRT